MCIGGGPSAAAANLALVKESGAPVIACNDAYLIAPWADICYFADFTWWKWHKDKPAFREFAGQKCTIENTGGMVADPAVYMLHNYGQEHLSEKANGVHTGSNGGYQAVNIAVLAGAAKILLTGYDMRFPGGKSHWHKGHPLPTPEGRYAEYARRYKSMLPQLAKLGVEVVNCTPGSLIQCFRFSTLEKELL